MFQPPPLQKRNSPRINTDEHRGEFLPGAASAKLVIAMRLRHFPVRLVFLLGMLAACLPAQQVPSTQPRLPIPPLGWPQPTAAGLPWPQGLGRGEAITGHIGAIDKDQIMVKSLDYGDVLFWVDDKTVVRVDKFRLALSDLRVGDPVAVRLKKIKGRGPYATEILPHPDVRARKEHPETAQPAAAPAGVTSPDMVAGAALPAASPAGTPAPAAQPAAAPEPELPFPDLPPNTKGVVGTVTAASSDSIAVRDASNQTQKVLVTSVTRIHAPGSQTDLPTANSGDRVAVIGDRLDDGRWIAREILVNRRPSAASSAPAAPGQAAAASAATSTATQPQKGDGVSPDGLVRFSGAIVSLGDGEIRVKTAAGERAVLVTGITEVRRMGVRGNFASLRVGDEVKVAGDPLEGGLISAREVTVTKLAGS
jgi:hypothetical protein